MKSFLHSVLWLAVFILFTQADGCNGNEENQNSRTKNEIEATRTGVTASLCSTIPSSGTLMAFNDAASNCFIDFTDYYKILSDTSLDTTFRNQAALMIRNQFISGECKLRFTGPSCSMSVELITSSGNKLCNPVLKISPDTTWIISELKKNNDSLYSGRLGFILAGEKNERKIFDPGRSGNVEYYAVRKIKPFGSDSLFVWTVQLGNIQFP